MLKTIEEAYKKLNDKLFGSRLPLPNIQVDISRKYVMRWELAGNFLYIGAPFAKATTLGVLEALVHEMIHIENHQKEITDVKANQYHNSKFLKSALAIGFFVRRHPSQRWSLTTAHMPSASCHKPDSEQNKKLLAVLESINFCPKNLEKDINFVMATLKDSKPTKSFFLKYECKCPPPHNSIRSGRRPDSPNALDILCRKCQAVFQCV